MDAKDGCAFPNTLIVNAGSVDPFQKKRVETQQVYHCPGLSVRAYVATKLMAAIISNSNVKVELTASATAILACGMADALIAELSKS